MNLSFTFQLEADSHDIISITGRLGIKSRTNPLLIKLLAVTQKQEKE